MTEKPSVLIVDDEIEIAEILAALLEEAFLCTAFDKAKDALAILPGQSFDYIISDIEMPDINGIRFIEEARKIRPDCLVFVSTGHDHYHPKVKAALKAGADGVLTKPYADPDSLVEHLLNFRKKS